MASRPLDALPLTHHSAARLAAAVRGGEVSSRVLVEAHLERIAQVNAKLNAVVQLAPDALQRAADADARLARGDLDGPLHGVPFTLKDSFDTAGLRSTAGTAGWRDRIPRADATVAARLKAAGAILLGKTNTPEFTWSDETDNDVYGRTSNPYDLERTPGGSSGGGAAIVAAAASPFDVGSDTGDSIRQPAHVCGIAGIKPTTGRVPRTGHWPGFAGMFQSFTQLGPLARWVEDLPLVLGVIAAPDGVDPHIAPVALEDGHGVRLRDLRAVVFTDNGVRSPTHETVGAVLAAADALGSAGVSVRAEVPPDIGPTWRAWDAMIRADGHTWLTRLISGAGTPGTGSYATRGWVDFAPPRPGDEIGALVEEVDELRSRWLAWGRDVDLVISPVMTQPAIRHGESNAAWFGDTYSDIHNLTGWPSVVVRAGTAPGGLPIGVQVVARPWREHLAIAAALEVERVLGGWVAPPL